MALQTVNFTANTNWTVPSRAYILSVFLVGGGGAGGNGGGGGGAGGRVLLSSGYLTTPGSVIGVTIGPGGAPNGGTGGTTVFGALSVAGGTGGANTGGSGGSTSANIYGTISNRSGGAGNGDSGAGGASPANNGSNSHGAGAAGFNFNGTFYAGGGGGGYGTFNQSTARPLRGAPGGAGGGGWGGGEGAPGSPGAANTGGGGGGGCRAGTLVTRGTLGNYNNSPAAPYNTVANQNGGAGGSGFVQIRYDEAEAFLTTSGSGVAEGDSIVVYLKTKNIPNGTVLGFTLSGSGITASDFTPASLTGSFTVSSTDGGLTGTASTTITVASDAGITEVAETVTITLVNNLASTTFNIGDLYQSPISPTTDSPGNLVIGRQYTISSVGTTVWTDLGASANTIGTTFTATGTGLVPFGNFVVGRSYTIVSVGNTDFTKIGAAANTVGTTFTATGTGLVNAGSFVIGNKYCIVSLGDTVWGDIDNPPTSKQYNVNDTFTAGSVGSGTGIAMPVISLGINSPIGTASQGSGTASGTWVSKTIQVSDFNDIRNKVAGVLGTGSGASGYGQTLLSSPITTSNKVTVTDWNNLKYDIINAYYHQVGTIPSLPTVSTGETVKANVVTTPYRKYDTWADVIVAQKFNIASSQAIVRTSPASGAGQWYTETSWPGALGATWDTRIYAVVNVLWDSASAARYFFNSGGEIRFNSTRVNTSLSSPQTMAWTSLLAGSGTVGFGGDKPINGTGTANGGNFYRLDNTFRTVFSSTATNPYSTNTYKISARTPGVADNSTGAARSIEFMIEWLDQHVALGGVTEAVDGTFRLTLSTLEASGVLQPAAAGTFSVSSPTIVFTTPITT